jgi:thiamine-monophosphate kinase
MTPRRRTTGRVPSEFALIKRYFAPLAAKAPLAFGLEDDAAIVRVAKTADIVVTKDAILAGVHFLENDPPDKIAQKLLRVNLSDLAAKGATPLAYLMSTALPSDMRESWLAAFARGLAKDQRSFGISLIGGDTVSTPGPLTLSVTMMGTLPRGAMRRRVGAKPGDRIFVTGTLGDAYFGLRLLRGKSFSWLGPRLKRTLIDRYHVPRPRVRFGVSLGRLATSAIDVSDGLMADLEHIAKASRVGAVVSVEKIPLSVAARAIVRRDAGELARLAVHGDDYEILFTVPASRIGAVGRLARAAKTRVTEIGHIVRGMGVVLADRDGGRIPLPQRGFTHF